jgi:hypothetical protein
MEKKIINKEQSVFKTEMIPTTVFVANDGKEFTQEMDCIDYEKRLKAIEVGQSQFKELELDEYLEKALINTCFPDVYNESSIKLIVWDCNSKSGSLNSITEAAAFLRAKGFNVVSEEKLGKTKPNTKYLIASWWEHESSDSPDQYGAIIELTEAIEKINNLKNILEKCI